MPEKNGGRLWWRKKSKGRKRHIITDTLGRLLSGWSSNPRSKSNACVCKSPIDILWSNHGPLNEMNPIREMAPVPLAATLDQYFLDYRQHWWSQLLPAIMKWQPKLFGSHLVVCCCGGKVKHLTWRKHREWQFWPSKSLWVCCGSWLCPLIRLLREITITPMALCAGNCG